MSFFPAVVLRQFVRKRSQVERCETCGEALHPNHEHNFDRTRRTLRCTCPLCALAQDDIYPRMPKSARALPHFKMSEQQWNNLAIPVALAFFSYRTLADTIGATTIVVQYPGPAGVLESQVSVDNWEDLCLQNQELRNLLPDVQALLVNRVGSVRGYFIVPIDACFRLSGLIRRHWQGFSGGAALWVQIATFFDELNRGCEADTYPADPHQPDRHQEIV
jgi:hypothetical protein